MDRLTEALNIIKTNEMASNKECIVPYSKLVGKVLEVMKAEGYIEDYEEVLDRERRTKYLRYYHVKLKGRINNCKAIKPRFPSKKNEWVRWEQQFLPGFGVGVLIVSTPKGIMDHRKAQELGLGGRLIAFVF